MDDHTQIAWTSTTFSTLGIAFQLLSAPRLSAFAMGIGVTCWAFAYLAYRRRTSQPSPKN